MCQAHTQTVVLSNATDILHNHRGWNEPLEYVLSDAPPAEADHLDLIVWDPVHWSPLIQ